MKHENTFGLQLELYETGLWDVQEIINRANEFCVTFVERIMESTEITDDSRLKIINDMYADYRAFKAEIKMQEEHKQHTA